MQLLFFKSMDPQLSKTVPGIPLRPLNRFLHVFEVRSILVKIVIFAILTFRKLFHRTLKIVLGVARTFPGRFWKAEGPYFWFPNSDLEFGPFCNPNGILGFLHPKRTNFSIIPFWVLKGMKICNFVDAIFIFEKYGPWAFQNRSGNVATTFRYDFM